MSLRLQRDDKGHVETGGKAETWMQGEASERQCGAPDPVKQGGGADPTSGSDHTWPFLPLPKAGWGLTRFPRSQVKVDKSCVLEHVTRDRVRRDQRRRPPTRVHLKEVRPCPQLGRVGGRLSLGLQLLRWQRARGLPCS